METEDEALRWVVISSIIASIPGSKNPDTSSLPVLLRQKNTIEEGVQTNGLRQLDLAVPDPTAHITVSRHVTELDVGVSNSRFEPLLRRFIKFRSHSIDVLVAREPGICEARCEVSHQR